MVETVRGMVVSKKEDEITGSAHIKLELVDYQIVNLVYDNTSSGVLPSTQQWIQVEYHPETNVIEHIEKIHEPEIRMIKQERKRHEKNRPITKFFAVLAGILGAFVGTLSYFNVPLMLLFLGPFLIVLCIALVAAVKEV